MSKSGKLTVAELKKIIRALPYAEPEQTLCALYRPFNPASFITGAYFQTV